MNERDSSMKHHGMQVLAMPDGRRFRATVAAGCVALSFPAMEALAQSGPYPARPVRMIVPLPAGGPTDILARLAADGVDAPVVVGGIIPEADQATLLASGVAAVYTPKDFELSRIMRDVADLAVAHRGG